MSKDKEDPYRCGLLHTPLQLPQTNINRHVVISSVVAYPPPQIHNLERQAHGLTVLLQEGIAAVHEVIALGRSVIEGGA